MGENKLYGIFDLAEGVRLKEQGIETASMSRSEALDLAREIALRVASARSSRTCTADDVYRKLYDMLDDVEVLGPAAGAIFRGEDWEWRGEWIQSVRMTNHARMIRVWHLKERVPCANKASLTSLSATARAR